MKLKKVVIIGTGLIGGSIGKALLEKDLADEVIGICRRQPTLDRTLKEKAISRGFVESYEEALPGAQIVFIATPVHTIKEVFEKIAEACSPGTIVTDVGSTKKEIVEIAKSFKDKFSFVGGHPLAGSEKTGVEFSSADLFENSVCILTPTDKSPSEDVEKLKNFWEKIGATVEILSPQKHDENLALSSHLPHIVAYALSGARETAIPKNMFAAGFKDTTRIASSDTLLWSDILMSNRDNILKAIERFKETLSGIESAMKENAEEDLKKLLERYKTLRDELFKEG
jgi:prephenate dehydrogenase